MSTPPKNQYIAEDSNKRKRPQKRLPPLVLLSYQQSPVLDPAAWDRAFDILFESVLKNREKVINSKIGQL